MRKYLFLKLLKKYFLFFLTFFFFTSYITSEFLKKFYFDNLKKDLKDFAFKIKGEIEKKIEKDYSKLIYELKEIDKFTNKRITIINTEGTVIVDSRGDPQFMENHKNRPEFIKAIEKGEGYSLRFSSTLRKYMLYYGYFIKEKGIVLRVSLELEHVNFFLSELKKKFSLLLSFSFFTFFLFFLPFIWISLKDVYIVENFINNLAEGKHEIKLLSLKEKGLERMIENLNKISENLTLVYNEIKLEKDLSEVIDLFEDSIAIFELDGRFISCNPKFLEFLKSSEKNKYFWETIENYEIVNIIGKTVDFKKNYEKEIEVNKKWYLAKTLYLKERKKILLFLIDITEFKEIEAIKRDVIANISHGLKTPLTIIKGYIETLEEQTEELEKKNYIEIIKNQTEKLIKVVENMLTLSRINFKKIEFENVNLQEILENVYKLYEKKCKEKGLKLQINISTDIPPIKGDEFLLEQVVNNLVDNAVKFTDKGKIELNVYIQERYVIIEILDTGIGIPEEEIPKIFDKFYVGKKKIKTGTGLGLSIVKDIVDLHNGKIEVESKVNLGTKFKIYLPS